MSPASRRDSETSRSNAKVPPASRALAGRKKRRPLRTARSSSQQVHRKAGALSIPANRILRAPLAASRKATVKAAASAWNSESARKSSQAEARIMATCSPYSAISGAESPGRTRKKAADSRSHSGW